MVSDRIEALITHFCKGNKSLFAKQIGVTPSVIGNITGERKGNPSFEVAQKILDAFVTVNSDWFMLGRGSMLRSDQEQPRPQPVIQSTPPGEDSFIYNMYKEEKEGKEALIKENGRLEERVRTMERELSALKVSHPHESPPVVTIEEIHEVLGSPRTAKSVNIKPHSSTYEPSVSSVQPHQENL